MFSSRKREREDDGDEPQGAGSEDKKPKILPFRTSPSIKHVLPSSEIAPRSQTRPSAAPNITPVESSEDETEQPSYPSITASEEQFMSQFIMASPPPHHHDGDSDTEMMDTQSSRSPGPRSNAMESTPRAFAYTSLTAISHQDSQDTALGGRIPTPRWGYFHSIDTSIDMCDVPGDMSTPASAHPYIHAVDPSQSPTMTKSQGLLINPPTTATISLSQPQRETDHNLFVRRRRLPSPISEDENMVSLTEVSEEVLDRQDVATRDGSGHPKRDKSWVTKPKTGRITLSMGFRADCEKCRTRVPGHYNHVIRT